MTSDRAARARLPDEIGSVDRDGVVIAWERYGDGPQTVVLVPTWSIVHARVWKMQVPYLARHARVITLDPRGNGRSGRPSSAAGYDERAFADDIVAVLDATGTQRAALVSLSLGAQRSLLVAAEHPERVSGAVFIAPAIALGEQHPERMVHPFDEPLDTDEGWARYNLHAWRRDYDGFLEFFFGMCFSEPHSTKPIEDCVGWGAEIGPEALILSSQARGVGPQARVRELAATVRCPVLVIHGDDDRVIPHAIGAELARVTNGRLVTIRGGGHIPNARDPVLVNLLLRDFLRELAAREAVA